MIGETEKTVQSVLDDLRLEILKYLDHLGRSGLLFDQRKKSKSKNIMNCAFKICCSN